MTEASTALMRLINGYQVSQALHVAATLGIADGLKDGPKSCETLARACGAHAAALYRLLRTLAAVGVFHESAGREFSLTPLGTCLTSDAWGSRRSYARWIGTNGQWSSWGNLLHCIQSGESATCFTHGTDAWTYRREHPDELDIFNSAMTSTSGADASAVLDAIDFSRFTCVVDVAGGQGVLLTAILNAWPGCRGVLFDQPQVIASAEPVLASAQLAQRLQAVGGSFFEAIPEGGDIYLLKAILHDWDDGKSVEILRTCRRAMAPTATLAIIERVVGPPNEMPEVKFSDLSMMVQYGAQERTSEELRGLLKRGGFEMTEVVPTRSPSSIIMARPT